MAIGASGSPSSANQKKTVTFESTQDNVLNQELDSLSVGEDGSVQQHASNVERDEFGSLPAAQGLYNSDNEKDSCVSALLSS